MGGHLRHLTQPRTVPAAPADPTDLTDLTDPHTPTAPSSPPSPLPRTIQHNTTQYNTIQRFDSDMWPVFLGILEAFFKLHRGVDQYDGMLHR